MSGIDKTKTHWIENDTLYCNIVFKKHSATEIEWRDIKEEHTDPSMSFFDMNQITVCYPAEYKGATVVYLRSGDSFIVQIKFKELITIRNEWLLSKK